MRCRPKVRLVIVAMCRTYSVSDGVLRQLTESILEAPTSIA